MTGFGESQKQAKDIKGLKGADGVRVSISIRSVNGRFFDPKVHVPHEYQEFEKDVRERLNKVIRRGTLSVVINRSVHHDGVDGAFEPDIKSAKAYLNAANDLAKSLKIKNDLTLSSLLQKGEFILAQETKEAKVNEKKIVLSCLEDALAKFEAEREREGLGLKKILEQKVHQLASLKKTMQSHRQEANKAIRDKLVKRVEDLQLKSFDEQRVADEVAWIIEKSDIDEELTRLHEHLEHISDLLGSNESHGKKLDFYTQELLREVNTIGSKSQISAITQAVVEAKSVIEQMKEQVQNIE